MLRNITKFTVYCMHSYKYIRHLFLTYSAQSKSPNDSEFPMEKFRRYKKIKRRHREMVELVLSIK